MNWHTELTYTATIYLAGDPVVAERVCREYCDEFGLCVTVSPTRFVYTRGEEAGVAVGLVNYPRFPKSPEQITDTAKHLALVLREKMDQESVMIVTPDRTYWDSYRHTS